MIFESKWAMWLLKGQSRKFIDHYYELRRKQASLEIPRLKLEGYMLKKPEFKIILSKDYPYIQKGGTLDLILEGAQTKVFCFWEVVKGHLWKIKKFFDFQVLQAGHYQREDSLVIRFLTG